MVSKKVKARGNVVPKVNESVSNKKNSITKKKVVDPVRANSATRAVDKGKKVVTKAVKSKRSLPSKRIKTIVINPLNIFSTNLGYTRGKRSVFFEQITKVQAKLKNNPNFPDAGPLLDDIASEKLLYSKAKSSKNQVGVNSTIVNLKYMMKQLGIMVSNGCNNDLGIFLSSGFTVNKPKGGASKKLVAGRILKVRDTKRSCEALATVENISGAQWYKGFWVYEDDINGERHFTKGCRGKKHLFTDLPRGKNILLFVCGSGKLGDGNWSKGYPWMAR